MNKEEVIEELAKVSEVNNLQLNDCRLGYSAALVLYGIIPECNDIDLEMGHIQFLRFSNSQKYDIDYSKEDNRISLTEKLDIFDKKDMNKFYSELFYIEEYYSKEQKKKIKVYLYTPEYILREYIRRNREKDKQKIQIIKRFLESQNVGGRLSWIR